MHGANNMKTNKSYSAAAVYLMFLVMGFTDSVGPIVAYAHEEYGLTYGIAQFISTACFLMYGLFSIPFSLWQFRAGKYRSTLFGLVMISAGFLLSLSSSVSGLSDRVCFFIVLFSMMIVGAGAVSLQVGGNPLVRTVSGHGRFASNLLFGQTVKAIGTACGFIVPATAGVLMIGGWHSLLYFCAAFSVLISAFFRLCYDRRPCEAGGSTVKPRMFGEVLSSRFGRSILIAGFLFIGVMICMSSGIPLLLRSRGFDIEGAGMFLAWGIFFLPVLAGRLSGAVLMRRIMKPGTLLLVSCILAICGLAMLLTGSICMIVAGSIVAALGLANVFPLLFSMLLECGWDESACSGLMMTTISGGAFFPLLWGFVADRLGVLYAFSVPAAAVVGLSAAVYSLLRKA